ncbi:MAG: hypothetical protein N0E58_15820 [Candidatus Thiodiazotropha endolucinida]|uniref:Uncharacterized protein n=1 Tax=Candidatus Thiodiazotropha taylori TaxID=2792791 RepID=A0A9E4TTQ7_9GAMM|nr:hypothetical protein [Candidatus Thiodiazotropha taylori]MCW4237715.1 hypothetical protein [Candidatus Thiodiazotropha endolucinida]
MALPIVGVGFWKLATTVLAGVVAYERLIDKPDTVIINEQETTWKEISVVVLAAAGGFYLASKVMK